MGIMTARRRQSAAKKTKPVEKKEEAPKPQADQNTTVGKKNKKG